MPARHSAAKKTAEAIKAYSDFLLKVGDVRQPLSAFSIAEGTECIQIPAEMVLPQPAKLDDLINHVFGDMPHVPAKLNSAQVAICATYFSDKAIFDAKKLPRPRGQQGRSQTPPWTRICLPQR